MPLKVHLVDLAPQPRLAPLQLPRQVRQQAPVLPQMQKKLKALLLALAPVRAPARLRQVMDSPMPLKMHLVDLAPQPRLARLQAPVLPPIQDQLQVRLLQLLAPPAKTPALLHLAADWPMSLKVLSQVRFRMPPLWLPSHLPCLKVLPTRETGDPMLLYK